MHSQVIDVAELQDGMQTHWSVDSVAHHITKYLLAAATRHDDISCIVTFDRHGVSQHPNHIQVHLGVAKIFESQAFAVDVMTLTSVSLVRKYLGFADIIMNNTDELNYMCATPYHSYKAMSTHWSQFVWYRKLFTLFSRYSYCNSLSLYAQ